MSSADASPSLYLNKQGLDEQHSFPAIGSGSDFEIYIHRTHLHSSS